MQHIMLKDFSQCKIYKEVIMVCLCLMINQMGVCEVGQLLPFRVLSFTTFFLTYEVLSKQSALGELSEQVCSLLAVVNTQDSFTR